GRACLTCARQQEQRVIQDRAAVNSAAPSSRGRLAPSPSIKVVHKREVNFSSEVARLSKSFSRYPSLIVTFARGGASGAFVSVVTMAKKSFSAKKNLKSLFSKSEANLEESGVNDVSGGDAEKGLTFFKWKKKKKTAPDADKTSETTVSQTRLDVSTAALDTDAVHGPRGGDSKRLNIYGTTPRSKKGELSYSDTDLRKPRKFGTFAFSWKKKSKKHAADIYQNTTRLDSPEGCEEGQDVLWESSEHLNRDPGDAPERRVRFELSEPQQAEPQVSPSLPSGPTCQLRPYEVITDSPDAADAPGPGSQTYGMSPLRVDGDQGVQVNDLEELIPLSGLHGKTQVSATSAAFAALTRAESLRSSPSTTPPVSPPAARTSDINSPPSRRDYPHAEASHLRKNISEMASPASALPEPVTPNTDLSVPNTEPPDTPIPKSDLSVAVAKDTDISLPNSDLSEVIGTINKMSFLTTELSDTVGLQHTNNVCPKSKVYDTIVPNNDSSYPKTDLSDTAGPNAETPVKIEGPHTALKNTDISHTSARSTDASLPITDLSDPRKPTAESPCPNTDLSVTSESSQPKDGTSSITALNSDYSDPGISKINTPLPTTCLSNHTVPNTDTSFVKTQVSDGVIPETSLACTDFSEALSHDIDSFFPKTEISSTDASDMGIANTDHSDTTAPNKDLYSHKMEVLDTDGHGTEISPKNTYLPDAATLNTNTSLTNDTNLNDTDVSKIMVPDTDVRSADITHKNNELSDLVFVNNYSASSDKDFCRSAIPGTFPAYTNLSEALSRDIDSIFPKTEISNINNPVSDFPEHYPSDITAPSTDISPEIENHQNDIPSTDSSLKTTDFTNTVTLKTDTSHPYNAHLHDTVAPKIAVTDTPDTNFPLKCIDSSDTISPTTDTSPLTTSDSALPYTDTSSAKTEVFGSVIPHTSVDSSDNADPKLHSSLHETDLSEHFGTRSDTFLLSKPEASHVTSPKSEVTNPVIIKTVFSPVNDDTLFPKTNIIQPTSISYSQHNVDIFDTNDYVPSTLNDSVKGDYTPVSDQLLPEVEEEVNLPKPGLSVTEDFIPLHLSANNREHYNMERSYLDTPDNDTTSALSRTILDIVTDRPEARMYEDRADRSLAAETRRQGEGGQQPWCNSEPMRRGPLEDETPEFMKLAPPLQEKDQKEQKETNVPSEADEDGVEKLAQWREERRKRKEVEKMVIEKGAAGIVNLELVKVEDQVGDTVAKAQKEQRDEGGVGLQVEHLAVWGQNEQVKAEMQQVEHRPQMPAMEPDSPVGQEYMPEECEPTTEGAGFPLNLKMETEHHPSVLLSEENSPERADRWAANIYTTHRESVLAESVTEGAHTFTDTVTESTHIVTDRVAERANAHIDHSTTVHTLADAVTEREDSTLRDIATGRDPQVPETPTKKTGRFLDDLSGPWGAADESGSEAPEDPDTMNSGYGSLSTTFNLKPSLSRNVKEGRQRFHKVSLVSSFDEPDHSSSPATEHKDADYSPARSEIQTDVLSREERSDPGEFTSRLLESDSTSPRYLNSYDSPTFLDSEALSSPRTYREAGFSALSPEIPSSHSNSYSLSERSEVQASSEPRLWGRDGAEPAAPAERAGEGEINSGSDSQWLADRSLSPTRTKAPPSGVFKATRVDLPPSPTSPGLTSPNDMDTLVDTLKSMEPPQRLRTARPPSLSSINSLPPIVEDSPVSVPKVLNGTSSPISLPLDLGLKKTSPKDLVTPLEMMKRQQGVDGVDSRSRSLPLRASADSSIVFHKNTPGSLASEGSSSPLQNGNTSPSPSGRLGGSLLFSNHRQENGKPQLSRHLTRASSLPDAFPTRERFSSAPGQTGTDLQDLGPSRYSFLMSSPSSLIDMPEPSRISRPPPLSLTPPMDPVFSYTPSIELVHSPIADLFSRPPLQHSLSVESPLAKIAQVTPKPEPEKPPPPPPPPLPTVKYRAFPDAYLTKQKEHGKLNPRPGKLIIFTEPGLSGERIEIRGDVIDGTSWDLPETIYIRVVRGGWVIYEKPNYKGQKVALDEGDVELVFPFGSPEEEQKKEGEEKEAPKPDRKFVIGSLRRAVRDYSVPEISLFPEENAEGKKVVFRDTAEDARIYGFPIKASSIIISAGLWLVYEKPFMEGVPRVLEVGGFPNPAAWGVTKPYVGSVHPLKIGEPRVEKPNEPKLVLFDKPYFSGKSRDIYTHQRDFMTQMDIMQTTIMYNAGSIKVVGGCWVGYSKENFRGHQYLLEEGEYHDWRMWGGCDAELRSVRLIKGDFSEPLLVMIAQPEVEEGKEEEEEEEKTLSGAWIAYSHVDFSGNQYILEKGFYNNCGDWGASDNRICSLQPILLAPSEQPDIRTQVLLYSESNFQGQCQECLTNQESLPEKFSPKSCRVLKGSWVLYEGREYSGNLYILPEGDYPNLGSMGCPPKCSLLSLKVVPLMFAVPAISLFGLECFEGREVSLDSEIPNLIDEGFNDHVLSVRVNSGCWVVCEHSNYRGRQFLLEPTEISSWQKFSGLPFIGSMYPIRQKRHLFRIKNRERGHFLSIQGGVEDMKSGRVVVTEEVEGISDIWFYQDGLIKSKLAPSMCLQVMGEVEPGAKVVLWSETRQPIQMWTIRTDGLIISLTFPGMVLDMKGGKTYDRNHVIIYEESEERPCQKWETELL
ncbi:hypothetical protein GJAV_G00096730, partial [Gymnothorax javanicus]